MSNEPSFSIDISAADDIPPGPSDSTSGCPISKLMSPSPYDVGVESSVYGVWSNVSGLPTENAGGLFPFAPAIQNKNNAHQNKQHTITERIEMFKRGEKNE